MDEIAEKAKEYIRELQKLLELNFENPNEELKLFAEKNKMDLKDPKIKKYFLDVRKKYLEDINKFYEKNFLSFNKNKIGGNNFNSHNRNGIGNNRKVLNKNMKKDYKEIGKIKNGNDTKREFLVNKQSNFFEKWKI